MRNGLKLRLWDLEHSEVDHVLKERDTLRKQLDEAREVIGAKNARIAEFAERHLKDFAELERLDKQLDEARELLAVASEIIHEQAIHIDRPMTDLGSGALARLDD